MPADDVGGGQACDGSHRGVPETNYSDPSTKKTLSPMCARTPACARLLPHLLLQASALQDVAGLVGDQLGDRDGDAVEPARRRQCVERERPDGPPLVADRHDERALSSGRARCIFSINSLATSVTMTGTTLLGAGSG